VESVGVVNAVGRRAMLPLILRVAGCLVLLVWGIAHLVPVRSIVRGFGETSKDNRRIVVATWIFEGMTLLFVGALVGLVTYYGSFGGRLETILVNACVGLLFASAVLGAFTKARTKSLPMRLCPWIEASVGALFLISGVL
jgi:hypothetical protein